MDTSFTAPYVQNQPLMQQLVQEIIVNHNPGEQKIINNFFGIRLPKPCLQNSN